MDVHVTLRGSEELSAQIYRQLRAAILSGRLPPGAPLPPTRELARSLQVARNTVAVAYDRLAGEGFVAGRVGAGTFVSATLSSTRAGDVADAAPAGQLHPRPVWDALPPPRHLAAADPEFDLRTGLPDARLFPHDSWRRLVARESRGPAVRSGAYDHPAGHAGLRAAIARHVATTRAVRVDAEDVVVTNGMQQAMDLIARVLVEPGDCAAVEDPGYPPPRLLLESLGARVVPVPVDGEGLVVDALPDDARLVYVTPSHQYPLGMPMSLPRRRALLAWAARRDAAIVEDDYDSEFRFTGAPLEPLQALDTDGRVIYVGSFSKSMLPTLRLGFLVTPASLRPALHTAKFLTDWHTALPAQAALARFVEEGLLARHLRRMRAEYRARHEQVTRLLTGDLAAWLTPVPSRAGLHLSALLHDEVDVPDVAVTRRARSAGVHVDPLSRFCAGPARHGIVLGYGALPPDRIGPAFARLREAFQASSP